MGRVVGTVAAAGLEAEQLQDGRHSDHATQSGKVDGRA